MFERGLLVLGIVFLMASGSAFITTATPTVIITSPAGGSISTSRTVNVTGTAAGSDASWSQTSSDDFSSGTASGLLINNTGSLTLGKTVYDDFNDNSLDTSKWTTTVDPGLSVKEQNQKLHMNGVPDSMAWSGANLRANSFVSDYVEANLTAFSGSGDSWTTGLYLSQDDQNSIGIGVHYDWTWGELRISSGYTTEGIPNEVFFPALGHSPAPHTFAVKYQSGTIYLYMDGIEANSMAVTLQDPVFVIGIGAVDRAQVDATWDDVTYQAVDGNYTSMIYDSGSVYPVLTKVAWDASTPAGTKVAVSIRSGDEPDLSDASAWTTVTNGQSSSLPAVKRYIQYNVRMTTNDDFTTPVFKDITITYNKPVARVEVSLDQQNWISATGTSSWWAIMQVPENTSLIYSRVTDVAGDTNITSVSVDVDTTPPKGSIVINDNEPFTTNQDVILTLNATDRYGIQSMMISNSPNFEDATWNDYSPTTHWLLSIWDGMKTVYVKYKDTNGWESKVYSDSIFLETMGPTGTILIDDGAEYTRNTTVTLSLNATDPIGLDGMMVSNTPDFLGAEWTEYKESKSWALVPGSLNVTVYVKFRDMGGLVSQACSDSIIEDLISPTVTVIINGGALYSQSRNVTVELGPVENNVVASMQVREGDGSFTDSQPWVALATNFTLSLSAGEGTKTVSARLMDAAGNIGTSASSTIVYDSTSPTTKIGAIPATSPRARVTISWNATDATSGVLWYDVQSKAGDGSWTDWLTHVNQTSATFTGDDLQTYQFRARAEDRAGNLEAFPATVDMSVTIQLPEPIVTFILPREGATLSGKATFNGTCQLVTDGRNVTRVEWRVDNDTWQTADGLLIWGFKLDTTKLKDGKHVVDVRTYDGTHYSTEVERQFKVNNAIPKSFLGADGLSLFVLAGGVAIGFVARRRISGR